MKVRASPVSTKSVSVHSLPYRTMPHANDIHPTMAIILLGLFMIILSSCGWAAPDAGTEAVLIQKPWFIGHGGVDPEPIRTGRSLVAWSTEVKYVDMRPLQFSVHFDDFMSHDGVPLDFDAIIRLRVTDSVRLIEQFGPHWYEVNVAAELGNRVRQAVRKHGMNEMAIKTEAIEAVDQEVTEEMKAYFHKAEIPVDLIQITVGKANPPDSIKDQRIATATQQQRQLTEAERKLAEDQRYEAEISRAKADNAYRNAMPLTPAQFIQLESINMQRTACAQDPGCTFIIGPSLTPVLSVGKN
jgi:regulator of protease activity HflC (stomatin/prohibitin superfamily)